MRKTRIITEGAVLLAIYTVLLFITLYIPVLNIVTNLFLALPFILFRGRFNRKATGLFFIAAIFLSFIAGSVYAIPLTVFYGITGIILGDYIIRNKSRIRMILGASFALFINLVLFYWISVLFFQIDYIQETMQLQKEALDQSQSIMKMFDQKASQEGITQLNDAVHMVKMIIPSIFVLGAIFTVLVIQAVSVPIIKRFGIKAEPWQPIRSWRLPRYILWIFLVVIGISFLIPEQEGSLAYIVFVNMYYILQLLLLLQGISFLFFVCFQYNVSKGIAIIVTIILFLNPTFSFLLKMLGVIDLGTDWRKFFHRKQV
ncbi:YybS family protein [Niallia sp. 01092]|uniref:YybS family protein n=1 Tax=unclassified Niallia TaxID=2837522 RepID=UPI003FD34E21